jgi:hypothetical protein
MGFSLKKHDLPGISLPVSQPPALILLPPCDLSHIPGSLDPVASPAEDLEIIPCPLVTTHGDWPDVVQDVGMTGIRTFYGAGFMDHPAAPGTLPSLLIADKPPHAGNRGSPFEPVLHSTGSLAAQGMLVSRVEVRSLATAMGTGTPGEPLLLFRSILAIFTHYHTQVLPSRPGRRSLYPSCAHPDNTGEDGVKVFWHKGTSTEALVPFAHFLISRDQERAHQRSISSSGHPDALIVLISENEK